MLMIHNAVPNRQALAQPPNRPNPPGLQPTHFLRTSLPPKAALRLAPTLPRPKPFDFLFRFFHPLHEFHKPADLRLHFDIEVHNLLVLPTRSRLPLVRRPLQLPALPVHPVEVGAGDFEPPEQERPLPPLMLAAQRQDPAADRRGVARVRAVVAGRGDERVCTSGALLLASVGAVGLVVVPGPAHCLLAGLEEFGPGVVGGSEGFPTVGDDLGAGVWWRTVEEAVEFGEKAEGVGVMRLEGVLRRHAWWGMFARYSYGERVWCG